MQREIKFRAWNGEQMFTEDNLDFVVSSHNSIIQLSEYDWTESVVDCVQQYTGLKDKNGKEIYEGDIVKLDDLDGETYVDEPVKIVFENGAFIMRCVKHNSVVTDEYGMPWVIGFMVKGIFEVIGNIHENPNLLKEAKENVK